MKKVLLAQSIYAPAIELLEQHAEVVLIKEGNMDEFKKHLSDAYAVIIGTSIKFTKELIDMASNLKVISRTGVGVDNIDVATATERGIYVLNTPGVNSLSVAEHTVMLICALAKHVIFLDDEVRNHRYGSRRLYLPIDLQGKKLGLIGCGRIGRMVAEKCMRAFDMEVIGYDPLISAVPESIQLVDSIEEVFTDADFISLHVPFTENTRNLVDNRLLSLMKSSAFLINTSRGGIVDETVLASKLKEKKIAGAALDVFSKEPPDPSSELLNLPNVILTPHTAALTQECTARVAMEAAKGVVDLIQNKIPKFIYNKEGVL
ncbi:MAG: D-3-phosphoglycerate dehydrogenase / 2-oxoglutarate reductase [Clostridiales bacterium]|jgi:D-3-phosphoglycerate dehydrogenase|nr:D-3-phosphoglycerate dehydrogenase / 2-oxoglutarate reductase [Clostridiales bacterium]MDK2932778.1 D-3-phosphoglycerate dehydrogenase / 2-oxoglutarate reductase [Clostridiales bacterium]